MSNMKNCVKAWTSTLKDAQVFKSMHKYAKACTSMQKPAQVCKSLHKYAKAYSKQKHILSKSKFYDIFFPPFFKFYDDFFLPFFQIWDGFLWQLFPAFFQIWDNFSKILCRLLPALLVDLGHFKMTFYLCSPFLGGGEVRKSHS
jgi:hypothetical protein